MRSVILVLPYPLSANRYWRPVKLGPRISIVPTKEAKAFRVDVAMRCREQGVLAPVTGRVHIDVALYPHRPLDWAKRQRQHGAAWDDTVQCLDIDNARKVLYDAFKGVVIEDDKWVWSDAAKRMEPDEHGARVVVRVMALETEQPQLPIVEVQ